MKLTAQLLGIAVVVVIVIFALAKLFVVLFPVSQRGPSF